MVERIEQEITGNQISRVERFMHKSPLKIGHTFLLASFTAVNCLGAGIGVANDRVFDTETIINAGCIILFSAGTVFHERHRRHQGRFRDQQAKSIDIVLPSDSSQ